MDPDLGLPWPDADLVLSAKDTAAPTLAQARADGLVHIEIRMPLARCVALEERLKLRYGLDDVRDALERALRLFDPRSRRD